MPDPIPNIPGFTIPGFSTPALPLLPKIPAIPCDDLGLESLTLPNLEFTDVQNSLTGDNEFISFRDKANRELGSIRAESITEWQSNFFDGQYFVDLMGEVIGIVLLSGYVGAINKFSEIADSYNEIGVVYTSGNGDYAEWLERQDHNEQISAADIVAVRGGKISKDLTDAEQIMAVSGKPIVLGNMPEENREHLGHTIAFMGQIPVKVIGPVHSGDYIIGNNDTPGYGIAVNPSDMTPDYMKLLVGRSWETNLKPGPKMVNTVIGVDNGGFLDILKSQRDNLTAMEERLASLENALSLLLQESAQASNE